MKKYVKIITLLVFICLCFTGCAKLENFVKILPNGEIHSGLELTIDRAKIDMAHEQTKLTSKPSPSSTELILFVSEQMKIQKKHLDDVFGLVNVNDRPNYFVNITTNEREFVMADALQASNIKLTIGFATYEDYLKGQELLKASSGGENNENKGSDYWTKNLFTYTHYINSNSNFKETLTLDGEKSLTTYLKDAFASFNIEQDVKFVQVYGTEDKKLRSNATRTYSKNGVHYHIWELTNEQAITPNAIKMFYVYPNSQGWFLLTLILTGIFAIFYVLFIFYKKPLKK